jgi:hypothetical protein
MIELIEHNYIKLYPEFEEPFTSYNIISCTVFRMITSYKEEFKYSDGLRILFENFQTYFPTFYLRIYYDNSVLSKLNSNSTITEFYEKLFAELRLNKQIQLIRYEMDSFKLDDTYHTGLIGTFTRFYPFFDLKENKNINTVIVAEIDIHNNVLKMLQRNLQKMIAAKCDMFYATRNCYDLQKRFTIMKDEFDIKFPILAGSIITKLKFPISLLDDFFMCIINQENSNCKYLAKFNQKLSSNTDNKIPYGIDELFGLILKQYLRDKKIPHLICMDNDIAKPYYNMLLNYTDKIITEEQFKSTLQYLLSNLYNSSKTVSENYDILDNILFFKNNDKKKYYINNKVVDKQYILHKTQSLLNDKNTDNTKFGFLEDDIKCIKSSYIDPTGYKYFTVDYS